MAPDATPSPAADRAAPPRLAVGVVGVGRVGSVLGAALLRAGHPVVAAAAVSEVSRLRASAMLPGVPLLSAGEVVSRSDLVLLTVPDDVLTDLAAGLAATDSVRLGQFVVHTAGRFGTSVLAPMTERGALPMALHPAMTFTGMSLDLTRLDGTPFGVTTTPELRPAAEALVVEVGGEPLWVPEESRVLYHAAQAVGANHLMTLVVHAAELARAAGIAEPQRLLAPLLGAALDNSLRDGAAALTGPVSRGDVETVRAHVTAIAERTPDLLPTYLAMARATADLAIASGRLAADRAGALLAVLGGPA